MRSSLFQKLSAEYLDPLILVLAAISPTILCYQVLEISGALAATFFAGFLFPAASGEGEKI